MTTILSERTTAFEVPPGAAFKLRVRGTDQIWRHFNFEPDFGDPTSSNIPDRGRRTIIEVRMVEYR